jgi:hypothetical protein
MPPYVYKPLKPKEIRILHLQAGTHDDPIRLSISHVPLTPREFVESSHIDLERIQQVQKSLPPGWSVHGTLEGRHLFYHEGVGAECISIWEHPTSTPVQNAPDTREAVTEPAQGSDWEAVSYCWGSLATLVEIHVVESSAYLNSIGTLQVSSNLHELLVGLRHREATRSLWIDAICINQGDMNERSLQVHEMRNIYRYAKRVVVWLGDVADDSTLALLSLEYMGQQIEITKREVLLPAPHRTEPDWWEPGRRPPLDTDTWKAIAGLVQRPYFERLWIMQELQYANEQSIVRCGMDEVLWYHLRRGLAKCVRATYIVPEFSLLEEKMEHVYYLALGLDTLATENLFDMTSKCACADARDKIYGVIGLFPPSLTGRISPDYSTPVHQVYTETFLNIAVVSKRLNFLGSHREESPPELPTWVPALVPSNDWRMVTGEDFASGASAASSVFHAPNELHVLGRFIDTVTSIGPTAPSTFESSYEAALELIHAMPEHSVHSTPEAKLDALHWTLAMGQYSDKWTNYPTLPNLKDANDIFHCMLEGNLAYVPDIYHAWCRQVKNDVEAGQIFVTSHGILGYTFSTVRPGDKLVVLLGCEHPILLRPKIINAGMVKSQVIGKSYVHGLMQGQAILDALPSAWKVVHRTLAPLHVSRRTTYPLFENTETGSRTLEDPRLGPLPDEWEEVAVPVNSDWRYAFRVQYYQNTHTKETLHSDPRLSPERLIARGVPLETIMLI